MKKDISKIILKISFVPYVVIILYGIYSAIVGASFFMSTYYGLEGFLCGAFGMLLGIGIIIPIIPICIIYQIAYLLRKKIKLFKNINTRKYVVICIIIIAIIIIPLLLYVYQYDIERFFAKVNASITIRNADFKIQLSRPREISDKGTLDMKGFYGSYAFVNYDKMEVGLLIDSTLDEFWKFKLKETTIDSIEYKNILNNYYIQSEIPLDSPGEKILTFSEEKDELHRTIAIVLIKEKGNIYMVDNTTEKDTGHTIYTNLGDSIYSFSEKVD